MKPAGLYGTKLRLKVKAKARGRVQRMNTSAGDSLRRMAILNFGTARRLEQGNDSHDDHVDNGNGNDETMAARGPLDV